MKQFVKTLLAISLAIASANAKNVDYYFANTKNNGFCLKKSPNSSDCYTSNLTTPTSDKSNSFHEVRIRLIDPPKNEVSGKGYYLDKPFFLIDGIHLSTDEERTLSQYQKETEEFGIPEMLKSIGYTPILVQFSNTVKTSLLDNSKHFARLLNYLNSNKTIPFPNKKEDGFIVMGISQGGIIGRFGSYLYDKNRSKDDTPIRLFASLDSPHQGAVLPRSLISTINFWALESDEAEAFSDLISGPGARDLLIYDSRKGLLNTAEPQIKSSRFLFGDYRDACNYKGFPTVLVAQGQLKGKNPSHGNTYFLLNRYAKKYGKTMGRAISEMSYSSDKDKEFSFNRVYQYTDDSRASVKGTTPFDFIQGSTYPFARTIYESLREGFLDNIPDDMSYSISFLSLDLSTGWDNDKLYEERSTFIPTASAMDLQCNGDISIRAKCAFNQDSKNFPFENPKEKSTAKAVYAVDPTHPRYNEEISGRHIESPIKGGNVLDNVLNGMQVDIWRILCEVAKADYDNSTNQFRNPMLNGNFYPTTSCMDQSFMPSIIKNAGITQSKKFGYARYDFSKKATEAKDEVKFTVPAGWQKVAIYDNAEDLPAGAIFEVDVKVNKHNGNWMKAELLLTHTSSGSGQVQLNEINVNTDGNTHTLRWSLPSSAEALKRYHWLRLVINSEGGEVVLSKPRLLTSANAFTAIPQGIKSKTIYPNSDVAIVPWSNTVTAKKKNGILQITSKNKFDGMHFDLGGTYSMDKYKNLKITYEQGTCDGYEVFFDAKDKNFARFVNSSVQNNIVTEILPLSQIINTNATPSGSYSASRLTLQAIRTSQKCYIKEISLE